MTKEEELEKHRLELNERRERVKKALEIKAKKSKKVGGSTSKKESIFDTVANYSSKIVGKGLFLSRKEKKVKKKKKKD